MTQISPIEAYEKIASFSRKSKNAPRNISKDHPMGSPIRQGDIYLVRIETPKDLDENYKVFKDNQLAPGMSSGSRHIVTGKGITLFKKIENNVVTDGPIIVADKEFTITHPEHAHFNVPAGTWKVTYQLDFISKNRVKD